MDQATRLRALADQASRREPGDVASPKLQAPRAKTITIASGKGGVGKTTLAVNLGVVLAQAGVETTLIDADAGTANADLLLGVSAPARLESIARELVGTESMSEACRLVSRIAAVGPEGLRLVPGASGVRGEERAWKDVLTRAVRAGRMTGDVLIVDSAAGIGEEVLAVMGLADVGLVVTTPEPPAIADAYALIKCSVRASRASGAPAPGLVVNGAQNEREARGVHGRIAGVALRFLDARVPLVGWVTQDARIAEAVRARRPVVLGSPRSRSSRDVRNLAGRLGCALGLEARVGGRNLRY